MAVDSVDNRRAASVHASRRKVTVASQLPFIVVNCLPSMSRARGTPCLRDRAGVLAAHRISPTHSHVDMDI